MMPWASWRIGSRVLSRLRYAACDPEVVKGDDHGSRNHARRYRRDRDATVSRGHRFPRWSDRSEMSANHHAVPPMHASPATPMVMSQPHFPMASSPIPPQMGSGSAPMAIPSSAPTGFPSSGFPAGGIPGSLRCRMHLRRTACQVDTMRRLVLGRSIRIPEFQYQWVDGVPSGVSQDGIKRFVEYVRQGHHGPATPAAPASMGMPSGMPSGMPFGFPGSSFSAPLPRCRLQPCLRYRCRRHRCLRLQPSSQVPHLRVILSSIMGLGIESLAIMERVFFDVQASGQTFQCCINRCMEKPLIWLDNAATTQKPQSVIDAISRYYMQDIRISIVRRIP